ncbi:MAG: hypothetical protein H6578_10205 [Chitinophagales bacterium]|nr:hypothetical protein [Chitinophagales bacterium]
MDKEQFNIFLRAERAMQDHRQEHEYYFKVMEAYSDLPLFRFLINILNNKYPKWNTFGELGYYSSEFLMDLLEKFSEIETPNTEELLLIIEEIDCKYQRIISGILEYHEYTFENITNLNKIYNYDTYKKEFKKFMKKHADEVYYDFESEIPIPFDM